MLREGVRGSTEIIEGFEGLVAGIGDGGGPKFYDPSTLKLGVEM